VDFGRHDSTPAGPIGSTGMIASRGSGCGFESHCHRLGLLVNGSARIERSNIPMAQMTPSATVTPVN